MKLICEGCRRLAEVADELDRLRWALEEIIQAAEPGPSPWVVINSDLIDKARAALEPPKP